ncbi:hypothetical protein AAF712_014745 [Marasmius tenuissimus]|uniref:Uncharacterized protein n=1 Tax=Marasmius tenuissimus TaxID=585030 RepID=A0ABR2ZDP3_9AGAR
MSLSVPGVSGVQDETELSVPPRERGGYDDSGHHGVRDENPTKATPTPAGRIGGWTEVLEMIQNGAWKTPWPFSMNGKTSSKRRRLPDV